MITHTEQIRDGETTYWLQVGIVVCVDGPCIAAQGIAESYDRVAPLVFRDGGEVTSLRRLNGLSHWRFRGMTKHSEFWEISHLSWDGESIAAICGPDPCELLDRWADLAREMDRSDE